MSDDADDDGDGDPIDDLMMMMSDDIDDDGDPIDDDGDYGDALAMMDDNWFRAKAIAQL